MLHLTRTNSDNADFRLLVALLDQYLQIIDGDDHAFYAPLNTIGRIKHVMVAYLDDEPVACGAFREYSANLVEIKRMFVQPACRGQGIAKAVLAELEWWAQESAYVGAVLETGKKQSEAIQLYEKSGYVRTVNYGQYAGIANSMCMQKQLA